MTLRRASFLFLCFHLLAPLLYNTSDAALSASILQFLNCSTSSNYTTGGAYAANVNQFLAALPENAVSKNGGFFNGTVGLGPDTVYGLAMCPADYSRADCSDCLAGAAASSADGLPNRCPGSTTVLVMFDRCLIRYSNVNFFGLPEIGIVQALSGQTVFTSTSGLYSSKVAQSFKDRTAEAVVSPQRFSASVADPYSFVQCTWDLPADKCKECLDALSSNASNVIAIRMDGQRKSFSCTVRYSNTSFMVVPFTPVVSGPTPQSVDQTGTSASPSSSSGSKAATVGGAVTAVLGVICLAALIWYACKLRRQRNTKDIRRFGYAQLAEATSNFADNKILGAGTFGTVYKGKVDGMSVAVKKFKMPDDNTQQEQVKRDFENEIRVMSPLSHRNIIRLVGWCQDKNNLFQVYELIKKGNLEDHLYLPPGAGAMDVDLHGGTVSGKALLLDWDKRNNILIGMASGLAYLHYGCEKCVLHRDIKPSNVVLDALYNAKLCDFGLVTQFTHDNTHHSTDNVRGTRGYIDPAYGDTGRSSAQNDIYSFGIVLLEIVCCRRPTVTRDGDKSWNNLVERVRAFHRRDAILDAADERLRRQPHSHEQLKRVLMIGLLCVQSDSSKRPRTKKVLDCLTNKETPLPFLSPEDYTLSTVYETGSAASTPGNRNPGENQYNQYSSVIPDHSGTDGDADTAPFVSC